MLPHRPKPRDARVVVVRHGPAELRDPVRWPDDDRRPLTPKGLRETRRAARGIAHLLAPGAHIATSAADRALRTAEAVRDALGGTRRRVETWPELGTGQLAEPIFHRLRAAFRPGWEFVLVGHEPTLAEFVGLALTGDGLPVARLGKGGAACLEFPAALRPGAARLLWLLTRKQLEAMAE